jgi:hypothetical protein
MVQRAARAPTFRGPSLSLCTTQPHTWPDSGPWSVCLASFLARATRRFHRKKNPPIRSAMPLWLFCKRQTPSSHLNLNPCWEATLSTLNGHHGWLPPAAYPYSHPQDNPAQLSVQGLSSVEYYKLVRPSHSRETMASQSPANLDQCRNYDLFHFPCQLFLQRGTRSAVPASCSLWPPSASNLHPLSPYIVLELAQTRDFSHD